ncbi:hypothetical protein U1Q18_024297 [Sarracenia purpurea var. burkii]
MENESCNQGQMIQFMEEEGKYGNRGLEFIPGGKLDPKSSDAQSPVVSANPTWKGGDSSDNGNSTVSQNLWKKLLQYFPSVRNGEGMSTAINGEQSQNLTFSAESQQEDTMIERSQNGKEIFLFATEAIQGKELEVHLMEFDTNPKITISARSDKEESSQSQPPISQATTQ